MASLTSQAGAGRKELEAMLHGLGNVDAKVGWFEQTKYETEDGKGVPVAYVATIQEFGSPQNSIPPRPFMRPTVSKNKILWAEKSEKIAKQMAKGLLSANEGLQMLAQLAAANVVESIKAVNSPPLSPVTLALRRKKGITSTKPLNETGHMIATIGIDVK